MKLSARDKILKNVKEALQNKRDMPPSPEFNSQVYIPMGDDLLEHFATKFMTAKGLFFMCENETDFCALLASFLKERGIKNVFVWETSLQEKLTQAGIDFKTGENTFLLADAGITTCEALIARTGSMIISSATNSGRRLSIYPHIHIAVAYTSQLVAEINDGIELVKQKYQGNLPSLMSLTTGPSRTADIEKTLVLGAHGPKELVLFLIDDSPLS